MSNKISARGGFLLFKFRCFCMEFSQYLCKMFSNRTHLGLMSKKKKRQDKAAQKLLLCRFALFCFAVDRKKENRLLASEYKDIGKILHKQEENDYRSMKFLLSPDRAPRIYPLYRGKTDDTLPSAVRRLAFADTPVPPVRQRLRAAPAPQMRCLHPAVP